MKTSRLFNSAGYFLPLVAWLCVAVDAFASFQPVSHGHEQQHPLSQNQQLSHGHQQSYPAVSHDHRAVVIDGKRKLLLVGHVHYPRATVEQWDQLFRKTKEAGLNAVDTYVFWNTHEQERGQWDFSGNKNLRLFIQLAKKYDLYVVLRIGPYVCAEWNYGGFPMWLREIPGIDFRNDNEPFKREMERFVRYMVDYVEDLLYTNGGSIILLQIENEYGLVERDYGYSGHKYIEWAAKMALSLTSKVPWFVCQQDNVPELLNACNGFYCDGWVAHNRAYKSQLGMFTENWTGWFTNWGDVRPIRPAQDVAFSVLRFLARGGTYNAYYMWFGGTNFGRDAGGPLITTSYDYDAPMDEYGFPAEPKYSHLKAMHHVLMQFENAIVGNEMKWIPLCEGAEAHVYGNFGREGSVAFVANTLVSGKPLDVVVLGFKLSVPKWSVSIVRGGKNPAVLYNSAVLPGGLKKTVPVYTPIHGYKSKTSFFTQEPIGIRDESSARYNTVPLEQVDTTRDVSDYLWYVAKNLKVQENEGVVLEFGEVWDFVQVFWNGVPVGSAQGGINLIFQFNAGESPTGDGTGTLQIVTQTLGLSNFGPHRQEWKRGIVGRVVFNGEDITEHGWWHQVGISHTPSISELKESDFREMGDVFTWNSLKLDGLEAQDEKFAYALDLGAMGKGYAIVNGHPIGRYWNILSKMPDKPTNPYPNPNHSFDYEEEDICRVDLFHDKCVATPRKPAKVSSSPEQPLSEDEICDYAGSFNADKCRDSRLTGTPTQRYYHVPRSYLNFGEASVNQILLFEELGGAVDKVEIVTVERV